MKYTNSNASLRRAGAIMGGLAALGLLQVNGANLLTNGDFETTTIASTGSGEFYNEAEIVALVPSFGWTTSGTVGLFNTASGYDAMESAQTLFMPNKGSGISQTVAVTPGVSYTLSWLSANLIEGLNYSYDLKVENGGIILGNSYSDTNGTGAPLAESEVFVAPAGGVVKITFTRTGAPSNWLALDDIQLVPEPSTYALLAGLGLIGFAGYRRYRG